MIRSELTWVVGEDYVQTCDSDKLGHSIDYYWVPELWHDRGEKQPRQTLSFTPAPLKKSPKL